LNRGKGVVDGGNVKELGVPRMQSAKNDGKNIYIWNKVRIRDENVKIRLNK
jgi:hypothetical protein